MNKFFFVIAALVGGFLVAFKLPYGVGVLVAVVVLFLMNNILRERFYDRLLAAKKLNVGNYIAYIIFIFAAMWVPAGLSLLFPNYINIYAYIFTLLASRIWMFAENLFFSKIEKSGENDA